MMRMFMICTVSKHYCGGRPNELGWDGCRMWHEWGEVKIIQGLVVNLIARDHLEDLGVEGRKN